jgi:hypothetical protein
MVMLLLGCREDVQHGVCVVEVQSRACIALDDADVSRARSSIQSPTGGVLADIAASIRPYAASPLDDRHHLRAPLSTSAALECDIFTQDCPDTEKCVGTASEGSPITDGTQCVPIGPDAARLGEACTRDSTTNVDDCEAGTTCWFTGPGVGTCIELCSCSAQNPVCTIPGTRCALANTGTSPLCLQVCNPLDPEACDEGIGCYPFDDSFYCIPDVSEDFGEEGNGCLTRNECKPGLVCMDASVLVGCAVASCCTSYCELGNDDPCAPGTTCVPWYEDDPPTDSCLAAIGVCRTEL